MVLVLKENSEAIRKKITDAGITVCACASFERARWLDFHPDLCEHKTVHGIGYSDETMDGDTDIAMFLYDNPDAYFCKDVDEFINKIKEYKKMMKLHSNRWPWGTTETVIIENGDAMVEMSFEDDNVGVCYISGLSVVPYRRREGLATKLMEYCEEFCRKREIFRLDLSSVKEQFVMDFYHKLGFCDIREENGYMKMYKIIKY